MDCDKHGERNTIDSVNTKGNYVNYYYSEASLMFEFVEGK